MIEQTPLQSESTSPRQRIKAHWKHITDDLELFFSHVQLPDGIIRLSKNEVIEDVRLMVQQHLMVIRSQNERRDFVAYIQRLQKLKSHLINHYKVSYYEKQSA